MNEVLVERKAYAMLPVDGITIAYFITVADIERSARFYEKVFEGRIVSHGDKDGAAGFPAAEQAPYGRPMLRYSNPRARISAGG